MSNIIRLPKIWKKVRLEKVSHIQTGIAKNQKNSHETIEVPYLRVANVQDGYLDLTEIKTIKIKKTKTNRYRLEIGDVLLTEGGDFDKLGRGTVWSGEINNCVHQNHIFVVRPDVKVLSSRFLSAQTGSSYGKRYFMSCSKQSTNLASINSSQLKAFPILLPPLPEQKAIADILSTWNKAIEKTEQLIREKERLKAGRVQALITSQEPNSTMGAFAIPIVRKVDKPSESYVALGIRSHFKGTFQRAIEDPNTISMTELYQVQENDLIVNITFAWEGAIALVRKDDEVCYVSHRFPTYGILKEKADPSFVRQLIISSRMKYDLLSISPGGAGRNKVLNKKDFLKMPIWLPDLKTQKQIGGLLGFIDSEIDFLKKLAEKHKTQKRGLMQKLLTGKWRVKPEIVKQYEGAK